MRISIEFDNWEEFEAFREGGEESNAAPGAPATPRRRRRTAAEMAAAGPAAGQAPAGQPQPGNSGFGPPPGSAPQAAGFGGAAPGFPGMGAATPAAPQANPLVAQIILRTEQAVQAGQPLDSVVGWYRQTLGPETAQANWEQIKTAFLPRAAEPLLKQIASTLGIQ